jgi:hypothetical protein
VGVEVGVRGTGFCVMNFVGEMTLTEEKNNAEIS